MGQGIVLDIPHAADEIHVVAEALSSIWLMETISQDREVPGIVPQEVPGIVLREVPGILPREVPDILPREVPGIVP